VEDAEAAPPGEAPHVRVPTVDPARRVRLDLPHEVRRRGRRLHPQQKVHVVVDGVRRQNLRPFLADTAMQIAHKVAAHCPKPQETVLGQRSGSRNSAFRFSRHPEAHPRALISCSQRPEGRQFQSLGRRPISVNLLFWSLWEYLQLGPSAARRLGQIPGYPLPVLDRLDKGHVDVDGPLQFIVHVLELAPVALHPRPSPARIPRGKKGSRARPFAA